MDSDQLKKVLDAVSEKNCNKNNIIEEIKQQLQKRYYEFYQEWKRNNFDIDYQICICRGNNVIKNTTLSHLAIDYEHADIVKLLIENGASVNAVKDEYSSKYSYAFRDYSTDEHSVSEIIAGYSLLHSAVKSNYERLVEFLIDKNADINVMALNGYTPLHFAATNGNKNIVNFLIQHNANVNAQIVKHYGLFADILFTPLHLAVRDGHHSIVEVLIQNGADPLLKDLKGKVPRAFTEDKEIIEFLKKAESKYLFNQSAKFGFTYGSIAAFVAMSGCVSAKSDIAIIFITIVSIACLCVMKFSKIAENKSLYNQSMKFGVTCGSASILSGSIRGAGASIPLSAATAFAAIMFAVSACITGGIKYFANKPSSELNEASLIPIVQSERAPSS